MINDCKAAFCFCCVSHEQEWYEIREALGHVGQMHTSVRRPYGAKHILCYDSTYPSDPV